MTTRSAIRFLTLALLFGGAFKCCGKDSTSPSELKLRVDWDGAGLRARWPARMLRTDGTTAFPTFELQHSTDLKSWSRIGESIQGSTAGDALLSVVLPANAPQQFYRVLARFSAEPRVATLAKGGANVFGYASSFAEELATVGQITPDQFAALYPAPTNYLAKIDWDPTTADFWREFNVNPEEYNAPLIREVDDLRRYDFRLNEKELASFKKNGFVVSERLGAPSPGEIFSRIWVDDLPVFIAADPILHAWHRSYDMMLAELEETYLFGNLRQMLEAMSSRASEAAAQAGTGPLKESARDADYIVTVARSLLAAARQPSSLGQEGRVAATLEAISKFQLNECFDLFGEPRAVDFSQFKPRGHYTESERLGRYFQCVMWLGRTELRVAGGPYQDAICTPPRMAPPRELGTAIVLNYLLNSSGQFERWRQFDRLIQTFVGLTDSMTFAQLSEILRAAGIQNLSGVSDVAALERLQTDLIRGAIGVKNIRSDWFNSPIGSEQMQLPQSFAVFGQKFVLDSWALSQTVFDSIIWDQDGIRTPEDKVRRRVPSALDVAFSVFGNDQIVPDILARIGDQTRTRHIYRDGFFYQHNLAAVRAVIDKHPASAWNENLYMGWLATLRELSAPTIESKYPDALRTRAWAMKDLNTQLASWTQIRHDTVLYAQQAFTGGDGGCSYPAGFVEPRPAFWRRLRDMAQTAEKLIQTSDYSGTYVVEVQGSGVKIETDLKTIQSRQVASFQRFAEVAGTLLDMSERELRQEPFTKEQSSFLQNTMRAQQLSGYLSLWWEVYDGWYPKLFYRPFAKELPTGITGQAAVKAEADFQFSSGALKWDAIVADVHTDVPCIEDCGSTPDPGSVLHQAIGRAHLLMIAINNGRDRCVYAGPVMSHYEFELIGPPKRLSDPEWKERWQKAGFNDWTSAQNLDSQPAGWWGDWSGIPLQPEWTRSYLVPIDRPSAVVAP
jgi:hypothetical protein